jgi:cellulose synthase (UDP-forming)
MSGVLPIRVDALEFVLHWLPYFALGVVANVALGRGSFRYLATEQYNMLKMFTFIWASTILLWPRALRFRVTPKHAGATPYALERRQLVPHGLLLLFIGVGVLLGVANFLWGVTARFDDPPVIGATLVWALASGGLLTFTVQQILQRLHGRDQYRFATSVAGTLSTPDGAHLSVSVDDLSVQGGSVLAPAAVSAGQHLRLSLHLPHGSIAIAAEVVYARPLPGEQSRLGLRFRAFSPADRERLLEFLFVDVARRQGRAVPSPAQAPVDASFERAA